MFKYKPLLWTTDNSTARHTALSRKYTLAHLPLRTDRKPYKIYISVYETIVKKQQYNETSSNISIHEIHAVVIVAFCIKQLNFGHDKKIQ